MRERATEHPMLRTAAIVAHTFNMDPIAVLRESDPLLWMLRIAAHEVVVEEENKAAKGSKAIQDGPLG